MEKVFEEFLRQSIKDEGANDDDVDAADYSTMTFKDLLAAAPLEGVDLDRPREFPREINL